MAGERSRVPTTGDPVKCEERWGKVRCQKYGDGGGGCMEPGQDGDVELHECGYLDVGLCTSVGGSGCVGGSVGVDGTDSVGSGGGVGAGYGDSDGAGSIGGSRLCGSVFWVD